MVQSLQIPDAQGPAGNPISSRQLALESSGKLESACAFSFLPCLAPDDPDSQCISVGHLRYGVARLRHVVGLLKRPAYVKLNSSSEHHSPGTVAGDNAYAGFVGSWSAEKSSAWNDAAGKEHVGEPIVEIDDTAYL